MSVEPDCIFCKIVAGEIPCFKLYEDAHTLAFMDINPAATGHCLAVIKNHWPMCSPSVKMHSRTSPVPPSGWHTRSTQRSLPRG